MTKKEGEKIIWKYRLMCQMMCTCNRLGNRLNRLGNRLDLCQRCTIEVSLTVKLVEEACRVVEVNNYKRGDKDED